MALIIKGDLLYAQLRAHKHPGTGHCIWSLLYVDFFCAPLGADLQLLPTVIKQSIHALLSIQSTF